MESWEVQHRVCTNMKLNCHIHHKIICQTYAGRGWSGRRPTQLAWADTVGYRAAALRCCPVSDKSRGGLWAGTTTAVVASRSCRWSGLTARCVAGARASYISCNQRGTNFVFCLIRQRFASVLLPRLFRTKVQGLYTGRSRGSSRCKVKAMFFIFCIVLQSRKRVAEPSLGDEGWKPL